ncbi:Polymeric immunoglobulin receptor [Dissostichus eleginoides]|nr:Polymeric immunoglobulin receptor [Dissostichus eleginoides]
MTFLYVAHLILTGLMGIQGITTVSKVSVKAGDSIAIPCLYNLVDYKDNEDGTSYWCAIEKKVYDVKQRFELSVTTGMPSLHVDQQEITAFEGGSVTVKCHSENPKVTKWCRLGSSSCVLDQTGSIDRATVTINTSVSNVFTVTMSGLKTENSGWYCSTLVWILPTTLVLLLLVVPTAFFGWRMKKKRNKTKTEVPVITGGAEVERDPDVLYATILHNPDAASQLKVVTGDLKAYIISLSLLIFIVLVTVFIWFMLKRHKQTKEAASAMTAVEAEDDDVTYSTLAQH